MESKGRDNSARNTARIVLTSALFAGLRSGKVLAAKRIYDSCFPRFDKRELTTVYGELDYSRVKERLYRIPLSFQGGKNRLQGYFYPCDAAKGLVVVCHGMHAGADDYIPFIEYFVNNGFAVFAYDCRGTYASEGDSTVGMCASLADLDYALRYVAGDEMLSKMPLFLFGHSWGGYAVTSVLSLCKNVKACAAIAPFNDGFTLIVEKGEQYAGPFSDIVSDGFPKRFLSVYQKHLFGKYTALNAVKGINGTSIPVFIAHGINDNVISFDGQSVISHRNEIREENVIYYVGTGAQAGHNSILHSERAVEYQKKIKNNLKELKNIKGSELTSEELAAFCEGVDHSLYSEVNTRMMDEIITVFENSLK